MIVSALNLQVPTNRRLPIFLSNAVRQRKMEYLYSLHRTYYSAHVLSNYIIIDATFQYLLYRSNRANS